jgi:soluble lytic murein transglycosylase-like protein
MAEKEDEGMKIKQFLLLLVGLLFFIGGKGYEAPAHIGSEIGPYAEYKPLEEKLYLPPRRDVPQEYKALFEAAYQETGTPLEVIESIAYVESGFNPAAESALRESGYQDLGMFQFNTRYKAWYEEKYNGGEYFNPMDPTEAVRIAALHLQFLYGRYGCWPTAILAYNAGIGAVDNDRIPDGSWDYLFKIYEEGAQ